MNAETDAQALQRMGTDARKWAQEYCRINPGADVGTMIGWFANAIEAGRDAGRKQLCPHADVWSWTGTPGQLLRICNDCGTVLTDTAVHA